MCKIHFEWRFVSWVLLFRSSFKILWYPASVFAPFLKNHTPSWTWRTNQTAQWLLFFLETGDSMDGCVPSEFYLPFMKRSFHISLNSKPLSLCSVYRTNFVPKPLFSVSLGKPVIPRRNWKQWLCKKRKIMESKEGYDGQYENGKSLYRGEESESPDYFHQV